MEITSETKEGIAILTLSGRLMFDESLMSLREHVGRLLQAGIRRFIFDFSSVPHCDSSGGNLICSQHYRRECVRTARRFPCDTFAKQSRW